MKTASILSLVLLATPTLANDYFVDSSGGSDFNGGSSWSDAWLTLTHALATVPPPPTGQTHTVHVAAGVHDATLGETFPLVTRADVRLAGAGPASTLIVADASATAVIDASSDGADLTRLGLVGGD